MIFFASPSTISRALTTLLALLGKIFKPLLMGSSPASFALLTKTKQTANSYKLYQEAHNTSS
jgi:hypothetical protein